MTWVGRACALLVAALLGGCDSRDTGYVQVQLGRSRTGEPPPLYLDGARLDFARGPIVVMQLGTGRISLKTVDSAWSPPLCRIRVRKNRISIVTVTATENLPRCTCQIPAADSTPTAPVCI